MATRASGSEEDGRRASPAAKRSKTGGRVKKSLDQMLAEARIRDELAGMNDDTVLPEELAAIYLGVSVSELAALRKPAKAAKSQAGAQPADAARPARLKMIKPIRADAVGQNQKVLYKLGALRDFHEGNTVESSFEAALHAGLYGFATLQVPFFAMPAKRADRRRATLVAKAWGPRDAHWARMFKDAFEGKLRLVWLTPASAASSFWSTSKAHKAFAKQWLGLLKAERQSVKAAIEGSEIGEAAYDGTP